MLTCSFQVFNRSAHPTISLFRLRVQQISNSISYCTLQFTTVDSSTLLLKHQIDVCFILLSLSFGFFMSCSCVLKIRPKHKSLPPLPLLSIDTITCHSDQQETAETIILTQLFPIGNHIVPVSNLICYWSNSMRSFLRHHHLCHLLTSCTT